METIVVWKIDVHVKCLKCSAEFLILDKDGENFGDSGDVRQPMSLQDPHATMRNAPIIMKVCDVMEQLGWKPYEVGLHSAYY